MQFILPLQEDGVSQRHSTTLHIMLAFLLFGMGTAAIGLFWFTWISPVFKKTGGAYMPFLFFGIAAILASAAILFLSVRQKNWLRKEQNNLTFRLIEFILLASGSALFFINHWVMPGALFALMAAVVIFAIQREKRATRAGSIIVGEHGILALGKNIPWKTVNAVLLRFDTLTIELTGNKMIQQNTLATTVNSRELETYCKQKIEANRVTAVAEDW